METLGGWLVHSQHAASQDIARLGTSLGKGQVTQGEWEVGNPVRVLRDLPSHGGAEGRDVKQENETSEHPRVHPGGSHRSHGAGVEETCFGLKKQTPLVV